MGRHRRWGSVVLAAALAVTAGGPGAAADRKEPPRKLTAMVVAVDRYRHLKPLKFPVRSGLELARELIRLKYAVTFLTDPDSVEAVQKELAGKATVDGVRDGAELRASVLGWVKGEAEQAQLALLCFVGHGVQRGKEALFLAAHDKAEDGRVSVEEVNAEAVKSGSPVVVIFDACRTPLNAAPAAKAAPPAAKPAAPAPAARAASSDPVDQSVGTGVAIELGPDRGSAGKTGYLRRTNLFASQAGDPVADSPGDLTASLAKGLRTMAGNRFLAHSIGMLNETDDPATLSLQAWFHFAVNEVLRSTRLKQPHSLQGGFPPLSAAVAQLDGKGAPVLPVVAGRRVRDLTGLWQPQHGGYEWAPMPQGRGWRIVAPPKPVQEPWLSGFVASLGSGYDTTGKALFVEYAVELRAERKPPAPVLVRFNMDGKLVIAGFPDLLLLGRGAKYPCAARTDRPVLVKIPLLPNSNLNYVGFSDLHMLPVAYDLVVRRLYLADAGLSVGDAATAPVPLLPCWWLGDRGPGADDELPVAKVVEKGRVGVKVGPGRGFRGGTLAPPTWVRKGDRLELHLENLDRSRPMTIRVQLKEGSRHLIPPAKCKLTLPPGVSKRTLEVESDGLADYFVVAEPTADVILLSGCAIRPQWK